MTSHVEIMKTKAEKSFAEHFAAVAKSLPGDAAQLKAREAAMVRFNELGLPHRRIEAWKYTDLRNAFGVAAVPAAGDAPEITKDQLEAALGDLAGLDVYRAVFANGVLNEALSVLPAMAGVSIGNAGSYAVLDDVLADEAIVVLNQAFGTGGLAIEIGDDAELDKPLMVVSARAGDRDLLVTTRHDITVGKRASLTLIEAAVSIGETLGQANGVSRISVRDGGHLDHIKVGSHAAITDLATWRTRLGGNARYRAVQLVPGAPLARNQVFVTFEGEGGELDFASAVLANGNDHIDSTIVVDHRAPGCTSRELFKGVLDDRARGVCQGKVIVQQDAQKTDGKQMAQALMLSEDAEFDSKPELEIYADDVACGHGSTSAEIDPDLVFYCRSRGIPEDQAKVLLTESFVAEVIDKVTNEPLRDALAQIARSWLAQNHANK
jgi:Fe-S cluster assembly protein SufD